MSHNEAVQLLRACVHTVLRDVDVLSVPSQQKLIAIMRELEMAPESERATFAKLSQEEWEEALKMPMEYLDIDHHLIKMDDEARGKWTTRPI